EEASPAAKATETVAPAPLTLVEPDGQRIYARDKHLADDIGVRDAGSPREQQAIDYAADQLRSFGYDVSIQPFSVATEVGRDTSVVIHDASDRKLDAVPLSQTASGDVRAPLSLGGKGFPGDLNAVSGKIAVLERGDITFQEKVTNAKAAGAKAV